jgi:hypothetical protein
MSFFRRDTDEAEYKRTKNYYEKSWVKNIFFAAAVKSEKRLNIIIF